MGKAPITLSNSRGNVQGTDKNPGKDLEIILNIAIPLMSLVCVVFLAYALSKFFSLNFPYPRPLSVTVQGTMDVPAETTFITENKTFSDTFMDVRNIFGEDTAPATVSAESPQEKLPAINLSNYKVVGILLDQDPRVVIEDTQSKEVFNLSKGGTLGSMTVEDIQENKVILLYQGQRLELVP